MSESEQVKKQAAALLSKARRDPELEPSHRRVLFYLCNALSPNCSGILTTPQALERITKTKDAHAAALRLWRLDYLHLERDQDNPDLWSYCVNLKFFQ